MLLTHLVLLHQTFNGPEPKTTQRCDNERTVVGILKAPSQCGETERYAPSFHRQQSSIELAHDVQDLVVFLAQCFIIDSWNWYDLFFLKSHLNAWSRTSTSQRFYTTECNPRYRVARTA